MVLDKIMGFKEMSKFIVTELVTVSSVFVIECNNEDEAMAITHQTSRNKAKILEALDKRVILKSNGPPRHSWSYNKIPEEKK